MKFRFSKDLSLNQEPEITDQGIDRNYLRMSMPSKSSDDESVGTNKKSFTQKIR